MIQKSQELVKDGCCSPLCVALEFVGQLDYHGDLSERLGRIARRWVWLLVANLPQWKMCDKKDFGTELSGMIVEYCMYTQINIYLMCILCLCFTSYIHVHIKILCIWGNFEICGVFFNMTAHWHPDSLQGDASHSHCVDQTVLGSRHVPRLWMAPLRCADRICLEGRIYLFTSLGSCSHAEIWHDMLDFLRSACSSQRNLRLWCRDS